MKRKWTIESAKAYIALGKRGLKYCSAIDFLRNHNGSRNIKIKPESVDKEEMEIKKCWI